jgi:hypothetical protein
LPRVFRSTPPREPTGRTLEIKEETEAKAVVK